MARKRDMIQIQTEVSTQEEWEQEIAKPGLTVVDVYPDWCGPCSSMVGMLKKIKFELGDDMLNYVIARSDDIEALETFRNRSEPLWIFFGSGQPVYQLRGAHSPLLARKIVEELEKEKKVLAGEAERSVISLVCDAPAAVQLPPEVVAAGADDDEAAETLNARRLRSEARVARALAPYSVLVVAPAAADRREEILSLLESHGFTIGAEVTKELTEEEVDALVDPPPPPPPPAPAPAAQEEGEGEEGEKAAEGEEPAPVDGEDPAPAEGEEAPPAEETEGGSAAAEEAGETEQQEGGEEDPEVAARREAAKEKLKEGECALLALKDSEFSEQNPYRWLTLYLGHAPAPPPDSEPVVPPSAAGGQQEEGDSPPDTEAAAEPEPEPEADESQPPPEPESALADQLRELLVEAAPAVFSPETIPGQQAALRRYFPELYRAPEPAPAAVSTEPSPPASRQVALAVFAGDREDVAEKLNEAGFAVLHSGVGEMTEEVAGQLVARLEGGESQLPALVATPVLAAALASDGGAALAAIANLDPLYLSDNPEQAEKDAQLIFSSWGVDIGSLLVDGAGGGGGGGETPGEGAETAPEGAADTKAEGGEGEAEGGAGGGETVAEGEGEAEGAAAQDAAPEDTPAEEAPAEDAPAAEEAPVAEETPAE
ncbi:thioredoxin domain-containing protein 3 homolog isoform X1 [Amphibalanus amphitrite]|uniref:thioredoxin domain-containing protein 3 homolog isoform X1 n=1 Tax=Amphibalanus amphitrite TaxID=1232801 RepID=UPI001C8FC6DE|nr:thioredoxin domain-containing protein 3 homolog isoform X1 [Amphibalanus amphitrite]